MMVGLLAGWLVGWLAGWLAGWVVAWLAGWLVGGSVGSLVGELVVWWFGQLAVLEYHYVQEQNVHCGEACLCGHPTREAHPHAARAGAPAQSLLSSDEAHQSPPLIRPQLRPRLELRPIRHRHLGNVKHAQAPELTHQGRCHVHGERRCCHEGAGAVHVCMRLVLLTKGELERRLRKRGRIPRCRPVSARRGKRC